MLDLKIYARPTSPSPSQARKLDATMARRQLVAFVATVKNAVSRARPPRPVAENSVVVQPGGQSFSTITAALGSITDASQQREYVLSIGAGTYSEAVTCKPWVYLSGAGVGQTIITAGSPDLAGREGHRQGGKPFRGVELHRPGDDNGDLRRLDHGDRLPERRRLRHRELCADRGRRDELDERRGALGRLHGGDGRRVAGQHLVHDGDREGRRDACRDPRLLLVIRPRDGEHYGSPPGVPACSGRYGHHAPHVPKVPIEGGHEARVTAARHPDDRGIREAQAAVALRAERLQDVEEHL
jgi:hypothetical protein